ncbi:MAG: methionine synthase [Desulfobacteraceae bacterium]|nr:methionine synthase [Desulfobacteraceae bacterium]
MKLKKQHNIAEIIRDRVLVLDGGMGTLLQNYNLTAADYGGDDLSGCNENLVFSRPDVIIEIHEAYLNAGADIIETNTFGATSIVLSDYGLQDKVDDINRVAVELARKACDNYSTPDKPRFVAGSCGPTTKAISLTGGATFDDLARNYEQQCYALTRAGVDYLLFETAMDTLNLKAAYVGAQKAFSQLGFSVPIAISVTIEMSGTMLSGQNIQALYASCEHMKPLYIGLNCATGPDQMADHIRSLAEVSSVPLSIVPNAGIPDENGAYVQTPETFAAAVDKLVKGNDGLIGLAGGCCGTTPEHIKELAATVAKYKPTDISVPVRTIVSGIEPLVLQKKSGKLYIAGERANVIGSRAFKRLISEEKFEEAAEIARKQVNSGADIVDICVSNPDRDEVSDMESLLGYATKLIKAPFMIDSQDTEVVETALKMIQGKSILNSVNLENKAAKLRELIPVIKRYGAAVVVGCIKEEMALTAEAKLETAIEAYNILTTEYGIPEEDIIFDPLVFPCGTGDEKYKRSARETIEGLRLIKEKYPSCRTILGISNVSFGLPVSGREVMNKRFIFHALESGLDFAIVNAEKIDSLDIDPEEAELCDDLLFDRSAKGDPVSNFVEHFRVKKVEVKPVDTRKLSVEEKLEINLVEGTKLNLIENLDYALKNYKPLEVINSVLMKAMGKVGQMFNNNELIVAEVLRSAEVMKVAVTYLDDFMQKDEVFTRGTILLATVKGDVHDIGKNLVEMILGNNGYKIIDTGIKCAYQTLIKAVKEHKPDIIGLSGLLVKSGEEMVITVRALKEEGINLPVMIGGAALTEKFVATRIDPEYDGAVIYCKDAMAGLAVANKLSAEDQGKEWLAEYSRKQDEIRKKILTDKLIKKKSVNIHGDSKTSKQGYKVINPSSSDIVKVEIGFDEIWPLINKRSLYRAYFGLRGPLKTLLSNNDEKAVKLDNQIESLRKKFASENLIRPKAVYKFFKVRSTGNDIIFYDNEGEREIERFCFSRQAQKPHLCLADYVSGNYVDTTALFVLSCGYNISEKIKEYKSKGEYFEALALYAVAVEAAESFAEIIHEKIRQEWGLKSTGDNYQGIRVSAGYPSWSDMSDQLKIWRLLEPDKQIGIGLTDNYMMDPEASISALVFHNPDAVYFNI